MAIKSIDKCLDLIKKIGDHDDVNFEKIIKVDDLDDDDNEVISAYIWKKNLYLLTSGIDFPFEEIHSNSKRKEILEQVFLKLRKSPSLSDGIKREIDDIFH